MKIRKSGSPAPSWLDPIRKSVRECASIYEAADALGVSPKTVRLWVTEGRLKSIVVGSRMMISQSALEEFMNA